MDTNLKTVPLMVVSKDTVCVGGRISPAKSPPRSMVTKPTSEIILVSIPKVDFSRFIIPKGKAFIHMDVRLHSAPRRYVLPDRSHHEGVDAAVYTTRPRQKVQSGHTTPTHTVTVASALVNPYETVPPVLHGFPTTSHLRTQR